MTCALKSQRESSRVRGREAVKKGKERKGKGGNKIEGRGRGDRVLPCTHLRIEIDEGVEVRFACGRF